MSRKENRSVGPVAGIRRRAFAVLGASLLVIASAGLTSAHSGSSFAVAASVQPKIQYLNDSAGTVLTFTIHNTGSVGIGAVEIARPWNAWKVLACPAAPAGWSVQRTDGRCRYRSAAATADDIKPHTSSSAFQLNAGTARGSQDLIGHWKVTVSRTNGLDDPTKRRSAGSEGSGLWTKIRTFQILDAVVVGSAPAPGSPCPPPTAANHSASAGATGQRIAICGRNRASIALTPVGSRSSLGGSFIASHGPFNSGSVAANSAGSVVLGTWSGVRITGSAGPGKTVVARIGSSWYRTSPVTTLTGYSTGAGLDTAPAVTTTSPADGAGHVAVNTNITFNFNEPVTVSTGSFSLECPAATPRVFTVGGSGTAGITLNPTADLPEGVTCVATAKAASISDSDGNDPPDHPVADRTISFTTDTAPSVTGTSPTNGASGVAVGGNLTVSFSEPVTAGVGSFTIECPAPGNLRAFSVSGSGTSVITLDPSANLPGSTVCTLTVLAGQISDVDGGDPPDHPAANQVVSFSTIDAAPTVTGTTPANGATHVAANADLTVAFSESVAYGAASFDLECGAVQRAFTLTSTSPGASATIDPTSDLPAGSSCALTVFANQVSDTDPLDPPDQMAANHVAAFTVDAAPAMTTTTPADGAGGVDPDTDIVIHFSEAVDVGTNSFTIDCSGAQTFTVSGSGTSTVTLDPDSALPGTGTCTVTAIAANISDSDGADPPDHPVANADFSFSTVDAAPSVETTTPGDGATGVTPGASIAIHFSEPVTAAGSSFTLECPTGGAQAFAVSGSPGATITLDPTAPLPLGETCTVTVLAGGISDQDGIDPPDGMAADYTFDFTLVTNQGPTDLDLAPKTVDENEPSGTTVGTLTSTDPDAGDTFTYALVGGAGSTNNGSFQISGDEVLTDATFDFETKASYSIRVRTTDSGTSSFEKALTITIGDVNETPTGPSLVGDSVAENSPAGTPIGVLSATDPDTGQTFTYSLRTSGCGGSYPDSSAFQISGDDLQTDDPLDFEAKPVQTICVRVTDDGSPALFDETPFTITVTDVNDAPIANPDSYGDAVGNTLAVLGTTGPTGAPQVVLTGMLVGGNDTDQDLPPDTLSVVAETVASTGGGVATINADGSFTFLPGVGDEDQDDTFQYKVSDGTVTTSGTVTIHIGTLVWYVDDLATGPHDGRSNSPFLNLAPLNGVGGSGDQDGPGDFIFIYQGDDSYGGGIPLEVGQHLLGERVGLSVDGYDVLPAAPDGPVISNASGIGVQLANGVQVEGLDIAGTTGDGIFGSAITTAEVGVTSPVDISNAGGDGVELSGAASGNIGIGASVFGSDGHSVVVTNRTGGTVAISGWITETGTGILVDANSGATINFTGGINASTGANAAFRATSGGTVNVTTSANTLVTTTGTALRIDGTSIGSDGVTFASIDSDGAANGIVLEGTGTTAGLTVTGTGGSCTSTTPTCSGGTINDSTGHGIVLQDTNDPSFTTVRVRSSGGDGIHATDVSGLTVADSLLDENGGSGIAAFGSGTAASSVDVTGSTFATNVANGIGTNFADASSHTLDVSGSSFTDNNIAVAIGVTEDADATFDIAGNTALRSKVNGIQVLAGATSTANAHVVGSITNNTIGDGSADSGARDLHGIAIEVNDDADAVIAVTGNQIRHVDQQGIFVDVRDPIPGDLDPATATVDLHVRDNTIADIDDNTAFPFGFVYGALIKARHGTDLCLDIASNTSAGVGGAEAIRVQQAQTSLFRLERFAGNGAIDTDVEAFVVAQNDPGTTADATHATAFTGVADGACQDVP